MTSEKNDRSTVRLFTDALSQVALLFQTEMRLVRVEVSEKIGQALGNGIKVGGGLVLLLIGLIALVDAAVRWLEIAGLPDEWGYLLIGLVVAAVGGGMLSGGINGLKRTSIVPDRAVRQVSSDLESVREHLS